MFGRRLDNRRRIARSELWSAPVATHWRATTLSELDGRARARISAKRLLGEIPLKNREYVLLTVEIRLDTIRYDNLQLGSAGVKATEAKLRRLLLIFSRLRVSKVFCTWWTC